MPETWQLISEHPLPMYKSVLRRFAHPCGAMHHHLAAADEHCAFAVAFRTPPNADTGLPHILEHTTLCGSKRYPVRDPFFKMLRRSLQTFMNAMTYPDLTCYPFASQVAKDFNNLLGVYLDAVFRPLLDPLDFAQEGHRLEPKNGSWQRVGVVFNEMKGAMDNTDAQVSQELARRLLPDTCYRWNYGGDPADIPLLTHQDLLDFHRKHYRPGNAFFATYGSLEPARLHAMLEQYIGAESQERIPPPAAQKPLQQPQNSTIPVPLGEKQEEVDVSSANITWCWGDIERLDEVLTAELIDRLLLGHAGAPLRLALEKSGLGRSIDGSGYQAHYRNGLFSAKIDGIAPADFPRFEPLVMQTLGAVAERGLPEKEIEAALHQLELSRREITGDSYPYGLELCLRLTGAWNHGADPVETLDQGSAIARLRERMRQPGHLQKQVRERFFDNAHRAVIFAQGDTAFHKRAEELEKRQVDEDLSRLDEQRKAALRDQAAALAKRQAREDDPSVLPNLELSDVPGERRWASGNASGPRLTAFTAGTNGILHHLAAIQLPDLSDEEVKLLPLLMKCLAELGVGKESYSEFSAHLNAVCGGIWAWNDISADPTDIGRIRGMLIGEVKGLSSRHAEYTDLIARTLFEQRFDELDRLKELLEQSLQRLTERAQSNGTLFAMHAAVRGFGGAAGFAHELGGLGLLARLKALVPELGRKTAAAELAEKLSLLLARIRSGKRELALISDSDERDAVVDRIAKAWSRPETTGSLLQPRPILSVQPTAFITATAVNYCVLSFKTVPMTHADAAPLAVACQYLANNFLHTRIREQGGAYGGRAQYSSGNGVVTLYSYRDPRLSETFKDMREGLSWLRAVPDDDLLLREAILGIIADVDTPRSPAGEAKARFIADLKGSGPEVRNRLRKNVLAVTGADIRRVAAAHLDPDGGVAAAVTSEETLKASKLGWAAQAI